MSIRITASVCLLAFVASASTRAAEKPVVAQIIRYSELKSEDGKTEVRLLTVGFNTTTAEENLLSSIMNSDGYWDHFRDDRMTLKVGDVSLPSGPRLLSDKDYTVTFEIPAGVKLADAKLAFVHGVADPTAERKFEQSAFAELTLTRKS